MSNCLSLFPTNLFPTQTFYRMVGGAAEGGVPCPQPPPEQRDVGAQVATSYECVSRMHQRAISRRTMRTLATAVEVIIQIMVAPHHGPVRV